MDTERYCKTLEALPREQAIRAIHKALLQLQAAERGVESLNHGPAIALLTDCMARAGHIGFAKPLRVWLRFGDGGKYESCPDIGAAAVEVAVQMERGAELFGWVRDGLEVRPDYLGFNYISLYWGDDRANLVRQLSRPEQLEIEQAVKIGAKEATC